MTNVLTNLELTVNGILYDLSTVVLSHV